jgi:hypothetical protein
MMNLKTALALSAGAALFATAGCSSSSSNPANGKSDASMEASGDEAGGVDDSGSQDEGGDAATCMPTSPDKGCASGTTCCFDPMSALSGGIAALASGLKGNCSDPAACTGSVQVKCLTTDGCAAGQVCCLSSTSLGPGAAEAGAGAGGIAGLLSFNAITTCQTSCPAGQVQACKVDSDCMGTNAGMVCSPLSLGALGGGAAGGAVGGGMLTAILGGLATETVCSPSDGGTVTSEGGTSDAAAPDAGPPDGGPATDAGVADAPADGG